MKRKILIVDDMAINLSILRDILEEDYEIVSADNGCDALKYIDKKHESLSLILLDIMMPKMNGFEVLEKLRSRDFFERIPIVVITGDDSDDSEKRCLDYGVVDFIHKPFNEAIVKLRVSNVIDLFTYKNSLEDRVNRQTETLVKQYFQLKEQTQKLRESNEKMIDILGTIVETRNLESGLHVQRVKVYTGILAKRVMLDYPEYGLDDYTVDIIMQASALHDVGKIAISDSILLKPGRLTAEEFEEMKKHTTKGCELLKHMEGTWNDEYLKISGEICKYHHERYDGKGYPEGICGDEIPISAQIVAIADVYDALIHERVYKNAIPREEAFHMIMNGECGAFSTKILDCFSRSKAEFEAVSD